MPLTDIVDYLADFRNINAHLSRTARAFVIADTFNREVFLTGGYTIGLGERMARYLK